MGGILVLLKFNTYAADRQDVRTDSARPSRSALELSHAELRAAVILAGKRIRKLNFGRFDDPVLKVLSPGTTGIQDRCPQSSR
jgi:hypothetical protein